jgi:hypothetical protein
MLSIRTRAWSVVSTGVLPHLMTCLGPRAEVAGLLARIPAGDQPIEQHADGGKVLLDGRLRHSLLERLYIGGDVERLDIDQRPDPGGIEPGEEVRDGPVIAMRVFLLRMVAAKNSRKRRAAWRRRHGHAVATVARRRGWPLESGRAEDLNQIGVAPRPVVGVPLEVGGNRDMSWACI